MATCCGGGKGNRFCGAGLSGECPPPPCPPVVECCGMSGSVAIRLPKCPTCLPMCPPPPYPTCPSCLCIPPPTCPLTGGCPAICGDACGGLAPCCPKPSPCTPKVLFTCVPIKKKCCPITNKILEECPPPIRWPDPPRIDGCCTTSCPCRTIDICYQKVCPMPPRCCPPQFPCNAIAEYGYSCCRGQKTKYQIS